MATLAVVPTKQKRKSKDARSNKRKTKQVTRLSMARGNGSKARAQGEGAMASAIGRRSRASAQGKEAIVVAGGDGARAKLGKGDSALAVTAAGTGCVAENFDSYAYLAAAGIGAVSISHVDACPSVAVGFEPLAIVDGAGIAISIGDDPSAMAGHGGRLVFVDTASSNGPHVAQFEVGNMKGIWLRPDVPYFWRAGLKRPEVDIDRLRKMA